MSSRERNRYGRDQFNVLCLPGSKQEWKKRIMGGLCGHRATVSEHFQPPGTFGRPLQRPHQTTVCFHLRLAIFVNL